MNLVVMISLDKQEMLIDLLLLIDQYLLKRHSSSNESVIISSPDRNRSVSEESFQILLIDHSIRMKMKQNLRLIIFFMVFNCLVKGQFYLANECFVTFDNLPIRTDPTYPNSIVFTCPSSCYTREYLSYHNQYPIYGNETYSGNSLVCKSAFHDGRLSPWTDLNSRVFIRNSSMTSTTFPNALRNGIFSSKSTTNSYFTYQFVNNRINESSIPNIAIEHDQYLYSQNQVSTITCRSRSGTISIEPVEIDQGWKFWPNNPLRYFTFPHSYTRTSSLDFCSKNNGTFMFWSNLTEENLLRDLLRTTIFDLFAYQRARAPGGNDNLTFFIGLKQITGIRQWESNVIDYNQSIGNGFNPITNPNDFCTMIELSRSSLRILDYRCDDSTIVGFPLCRLLPSQSDEVNQMIYRVDTDVRAGNLNDVNNYCSQYGGYPIYATNAFQWQQVQEIMLRDPNFVDLYSYVGLFSPTQQVQDAFWISKNVSYNSSLDYISFGRSGSANGYSYHLSRAIPGESFYLLYDLNPSTNLNGLRFCRKDNIRLAMKRSRICNSKSCGSQCESVELASRSDDLRFGFYSCRSKESLVGTVLTHSFPVLSDFSLDDLPTTKRVSIRQPSNYSLSMSFVQTNLNLFLPCYGYYNFDRQSTLSDTQQYNCDPSNTQNKSFDQILLKKDSNSLLTLALQDRRISGHHFRYIDYFRVDSRCRNQGIFHPYVSQCICAPGFYGNECQFSCPTGYYGQSCDFRCSGNENDFCRGLLICLPDPYGCSCYSGWYGTRCNLSCPVNRYGPDCSYECSCGNCNRYTGICDCNGTECYQGPLTRSDLESNCSPKSRSTNLVLIIVLPIVGVTLLISLIALLFYFKSFRSTERKIFSRNHRRQFSPNSTTF